MPKLDFSDLSPTDFEEFSFHLLRKLGFVNVDWRKGSGFEASPADSGRDIVCQDLREDIDESKQLETWFVDCKHYKRGVPPAELQNLLAWSEAEQPHTALIITSGFLSNPAKDYLAKYQRNRKPSFRIKYWERTQLERLTVRMRALLTEYHLIHAKTRSTEAILKAEEEFADVIWYDRKLMLQRDLKQGTTTITPEIRKGMLAAMKRVEAKYGKAKLRKYYKDDFEWGMLSGKLSALRWVLGEPWDILDT